MKQLGIVIIVIGVLITVFTGSNFITKEKVVDLGEVEITTDKNNNLSWSPLVGFAVIVAGVAIYFFGSKKATTP